MPDQLFSYDIDWQNNACINYSHNPIYSYIIGYKKAADILSSYIFSTHNDQDFLIYPIVFIYRQYIELQLKELIKDGRILLSQGNSYPENHRIINQWNLLKEIMINIKNSIDSSIDDYITVEDNNLLDALISEFSDIDPNSTTFRYPCEILSSESGDIILHIT